LNNEGTEVVNGLPKPDEGSLNQTNGLYFFFKMRTGWQPDDQAIRFTVFWNCEPDGRCIRFSFSKN